MKQISIVVITSLVVLVAAVHAGRVPLPELTCPTGNPDLNCLQHVLLVHCQLACGEDSQCCYENHNCGFTCKPKHLMVTRRVRFPELSCPTGTPYMNCLIYNTVDQCEATCGEEADCCYENGSCGYHCKPKHLLVAKPQLVNTFSGPVCVRHISLDECQESCAANSCSLLSVSCGYICDN